MPSAALPDVNRKLRRTPAPNNRCSTYVTLVI